MIRRHKNTMVIEAVKAQLELVRWMGRLGTLRAIDAEDIGDLEWLAKRAYRAALLARDELARRVQCDDGSSEEDFDDET